MAIPHDMIAFVRVAEQGSFAAAARDMSLTPSALSKIVTRLESRLKVQLLVRTTRRLALTEEGKTYLKRCHEILTAIEAAESEITDMATRLHGHIRVNAGTGIGRHLLAPLLPDFLASHPDISIDLSFTDRRIDPVTENVDIVLRAGTLPDSSLVARKIVEGRRMICASPRYLERHGIPKVPGDLTQHNCLLISNFPHLAEWSFRSPDGIKHVQVSGNVTADSAEMLIDLAIADQGIIRLMDIQVAPSVRDGLLVPVFAQEHIDDPIPFWVLTLPGRNRVPRVRAFLDFLAERMNSVA